MLETHSIRQLFTRLPIDPDEPPRPALSHHAAAVLVAVGGVGGSLARAGVGQLLPKPTSAWPWSTLIVNVTGSGLLALLLVILLERHPSTRLPRPLLGTGVLGGFTTFSTFAVDAVQLSHAGREALAGLYIVTTLVGSMIAAIAGLLGARAVDRLVDKERWQRRIHHAQNPSLVEGRSR